MRHFNVGTHYSRKKQKTLEGTCQKNPYEALGTIFLKMTLISRIRSEDKDNFKFND